MIRDFGVFFWTFAFLVTIYSENICSSLDGPFCKSVNQKSVPDWGLALNAKIGPAVAFNPNSNKQLHTTRSETN